MGSATYNRGMWRLLGLVAAGSIGACGGTARAPARTLSNEVPATVGRMALFELGPASFGPITPMTRATVEALQQAVGANVRIEAIDRRGTELHAYLGREHLFYVIPNDDGSLFNVHAVSPKISIVEHPDWIIGAPFSGTDRITNCECWGDHPMCFARGEHVAVGFVVECTGLDTPRERRAALQGVPIQRAVWNPKPFGTDAEPAPPAAVTSQPPKSLKEIFGGDP